MGLATIFCAYIKETTERRLFVLSLMSIGTQSSPKIGEVAAV